MSTRVTVLGKGPLHIEGDFELVDKDGNIFGLGGRTKIALCRCGASKNTPFCDGNHKGCEFDDSAPAVDLPDLPQR